MGKLRQVIPFCYEERRNAFSPCICMFWFSQTPVNLVYEGLSKKGNLLKDSANLLPWISFSLQQQFCGRHRTKGKEMASLLLERRKVRTKIKRKEAAPNCSVDPAKFPKARLCWKRRD